jgi:hypothetical protein
MQYKKCSKCKKELPIELFYKGKKQRSSYCDECRKIVNRESKMRILYKITVDEANDILSSGCGICGSTIDLCIDHCHDKNVIRGALCRRCNMAIGLFNDDANKMAKAIEYLGE